MSNARPGISTMPKVILGLIVGAIVWMYFFGGDQMLESIRQTYRDGANWIDSWTNFDNYSG